MIVAAEQLSVMVTPVSSMMMVLVLTVMAVTSFLLYSGFLGLEVVWP